MISNILGLICLALLLTFIYLDNKLSKVTRYEIKDNKIPREFNNYKIVQLSDFHNFKLKNGNDGIIKQIIKQKPDIIVMTGDMVNKYDENFDRFLSLAEVLGQKFEVYYIVGNHEKRLKKENYDLIMKELISLNVKIINNQRVTVEKNNDKVSIYGLDIPLSFYKIRNKPLNLNEIVDIELRKCDEKEYTILLAHNPLFFETYAKYNVDLILSGHVHGGMIRVPFIGGLLSPERKLFPKYSAGIYEINNKKMIVSRGLGHSKFGIRIHNMPEIVSIKLINKFL